MQLDYTKVSMVAGWVLIVAAVALTLNVASATGWMVLVGVGLLPPLTLFGVRCQPAQTMSESIREALK